MGPGDAETAVTGSLGTVRGSNVHNTLSVDDPVMSQSINARIAYNGAAEAGEVATADISELITELQMMLGEANDHQEGNPRSLQLVPVGGARWREVHSRLMSQAGAPSYSLDSSPSLEVVELQAQLQQSSNALKSSQQQLETLSARVEELEASLEAEVERMMASVQMELQAAHDRHKAELQELHGRLKLQEAAAAEVVATASAREAALQESLRSANHAAKQAESAAENERNISRQLLLRLRAYEELWWKLQMELPLNVASECMADTEADLEDHASRPWQRLLVNPRPESLLDAARVLQAQLRDQTARSAAAADSIAAAAAAAAADAAAWRTRAEHAEADAAAASLAAHELHNSLGATVAALHEEAAALHAGLTSDLEQRQVQVAELAASNTELEARVVRLNSEVSSLCSLQNALQAELLEAGERHVALKVEIWNLQGELLQARAQKDALAAEVSDLRRELEEVRGQKADIESRISILDGELHSARASENAQCLSLLKARQLWEEERMGMQGEWTRLAAVAADLLVAAEVSDACSLACAEQTAAALEEALGPAAAHLADTRRAFEFEQEKLRLQVIELNERLGQARARLLAQAARHAEVREAERVAERTVQAALRDEAAAATVAALCSRVFRAVERAAAVTDASDAAAALTVAHHHVAQQTARAVCSHIMRRVEANDAKAAAMEMTLRQTQIEKQHTDALAASAAARLVDQATAVVRVQALGAQLAESQHAWVDLSSRLTKLQDRLEHVEASKAVLTTQLNEALAFNAAAVLAAEATQGRLEAKETAVAQLQAELAAVEQERHKSGEALQNQLTESLAAQVVAEGQLASALCELQALRHQLDTAKSERQHLEGELVATQRGMTEVSYQLMKMNASSAELQARVAVSREEREGLQAQLAEAQVASVELQARVAAADAFSSDLLEQMTAARDAVLLQYQKQHRAAELEREQWTSELALAESARQASERECTLQQAKVREVCAELEVARAELQKALSDLEKERAAHVSMKIHIEPQQATRASPQDQLCNAPLCAKTVGVPLAAAARTSTSADCLPTTVAEGPLSHRLDLDGGAECETEALEGSAYGASGSARQTWVDSGPTVAIRLSTEGYNSGTVHASLSGRSTDLPRYDQRYGQSEPDRLTRRGPGATKVTEVLQATATAMPQLESPPLLLALRREEGQRRGCSLMAQDSPRSRHPGAHVSSLGTLDLGAGLDEEIARSERELDLCRRMSMLRDLLEAEREANAARVVTLQALRSVERKELQRQLEALSAVAATIPCCKVGCCMRASDNVAFLQARPQETNPQPHVRQHSISSTWELPPSPALVPRSSAPMIGNAIRGASVELVGHQARRRVSEPQRQRTGLPPLPPCAHDPQQHPHQRSSLERSPSQDSDSSTGSSSYWLPAAAAVAAAAADYDPYHEPIWMANAAFGSTVSLGCPSSAAMSETQVVDLAETIANLRAELAASQEALRRESSSVKPGSCAELTTEGAAAETTQALGRNIDGCRRTAEMAGTPLKDEESALLPSASLARVAVLSGSQTHGNDESDPISELVRTLEVERTEHAVRQLVLRALCAVERRALQRELADAHAAHATAEADAHEVRGRISALLMTHARVCGEVEMLRAVRNELAAELGPLKRAVERLRTHNEQLRMEASEAAVQRAADAEAAATVAVDAAASIAASEAREATLTARCAALAARCEDLELQLRTTVPVAPQPGAEADTRLGLVESSRLQLPEEIFELRSELASLTSALERLRVDYALARQDRQRLQQQLALLLVHTAVAQEAAAELCSSLHGANTDLDVQKTKMDELGREVARAHAKGTAARQQLASASADGRQRPAETRAWERQALMLKEQLTQIVWAAQSDSPLVATAMGDSLVVMSPQEATGGSAAFSPTAALQSALVAGTLRSSSSEATATNTLRQGTGWASSSCRAGIGRRCLSDMDMSSLAKRAGKAAAAVRLLTARQQQQQQPSRDTIFTLSAGLSPLRQHDAGGRDPFLHGLAPVTVNNLAQTEQICNPRLCGSTAADGAPFTLPATVTAAAPRLADGAAVGVAVFDAAMISEYIPSDAAAAAKGNDGSAHSLIPAINGAGNAAAAASPLYQVQPQPRRQVLRLPGYRQHFGLASNWDAPTSPEMTYSPVPSPSSTRWPEPYRRSQSAGGMFPIFASPKQPGTSPLLRLDEVEEGDREQEEAQDQMEREREEWLPEGYEIPEARAGQGYKGISHNSVDVVSEDTERGAGLPLGRAASETDMHLFYNPMFATFQETAGAGLGAGRRGLQLLPASARTASDDASYVTDLQAALARARPAGDCTLPAAAGQAYPSRPQALSSSRRGIGTVFARVRRLSADHRAGESERSLLSQGIPLWQMSASRTQPASLAGAPLSGPDMGSAYSAWGTDGGERLVPVSRSNPVVKLYKKISKRLSSNASRDNREGL
ncbi:hypothetical protein VaNZ11_005502 [Volvox africanus]|uniref:Uncharacterized protein n=1 Tax=Volvox africanus TaxID=51714 RepID=A0ABQ5RYP3_9CHLO|nr:hypothetical protein VaNZ11_005502 [Volvox africanus]